MIGNKVVFSTEWFAVEEVPAQPEWGGGGRPFYFITGMNGVIILPVTTDGRILMVRQYRPARGRVTVELPAGMVDTGETPPDAALRELREETGYAAGELHFLGRSGLEINRDTRTQFCFLALGVDKVPDAAPEAGIETLLLTPADIGTLVRSGEFEHLGGLGVITQAQILFADRMPRFW